MQTEIDTMETCPYGNFANVSYTLHCKISIEGTRIEARRLVNNNIENMSNQRGTSPFLAKSRLPDS